jgi:hypothetical protein
VAYMFDAMKQIEFGRVGYSTHIHSRKVVGEIKVCG